MQLSDGEDGMQFLILGALEVRDGGRLIHITAPKVRAVLAALLLNVNGFVAVDHLAEYVWDGPAPEGYRATLRTYVYRLRQHLAGLPAVALNTDTAGYRLQVGSDSVDATRFRALVGRAREMVRAGDLECAATELRQALAICRGRTLANLRGELLQQEAQFIDRERLAAYEEHISIEIALGNHRQVIPELAKLVVAHPFREVLTAQLMVALYRSGQQVEALQRYALTRHRLRKELGIEPGAELQMLQHAILGRTPPDGLTVPSWTDRSMASPTRRAAS
jgi:DNA-binding SARP family transcriptional activator